MIIERFATKCPCWGTNLTQQSLPRGKRDKRYKEYYDHFAAGTVDLMLHSLGCSRASADYQSDRWNQASNTNAIAHAVIDSNDGDARQNLRWDMRAWHCGNPGNNTCIGIEMCESDQIEYYDKKRPWVFRFKDKAQAQRHCKTAYEGAVKLFADLCDMFHLDPLVNILSHKEGHDRGIASNHGDPEHYWSQIGLGYTMDGFRADVKKKMKENDMTREDTQALINEVTKPIKKQVDKLVTSIDQLTEQVQQLISAPKELLDNDAGKWSAEARQKAIDSGMVAGVGVLPSGEPNYAWQAPVTREQLMLILLKLGFLDPDKG